MKSNKKWKNLTYKMNSSTKVEFYPKYNYLVAKNISIGESYKEMKSLYYIYKMFNKMDKKDLESCKKLIKENINHLEYLYKINQENDNRSGKESYGYTDEESILINLAYISDRWNCKFRIKWLIDLIKL